MLSEKQNKRLTSAEKQNLLSFIAAAQILTEFPEEYAPLVGRVEGGNETYDAIREKLEALEREILKAVPTDQQRALLKQSKFTSIRVVSKADARDLGEDWVAQKDDLVYLANAAIQGKCFMCEDTAGYKCKLKKLLAELPISRTQTTSVTMACMNATDDF